MFYKLDENKNVIPSSLNEWSDFIEGQFPTNFNHVGDHKINEIRVSTIFIGLCCNFGGNKKPMVFETIIFENEKAIYQKKYSTWKEAEEGHKKAIELVKNINNDE